jgi:phage regulator Rha-like protein
MALIGFHHNHWRSIIMNELEKINNIVSISSLDIAKLTGKEHKNVLADIRNILAELELAPADFLADGSITRLDGSTLKIPVFNLPKREALILASGYSIKLRTLIIDKLEELSKQNKLPQTYKEALIELVATIEAKEKLEIENKQLGTTVNNLQTCLDDLLEWVSILKVAKLNNISEKTFNWRDLKRVSNENGYLIKKAQSPRYGFQNLYNVNAFKILYPKLNYNFK